MHAIILAGGKGTRLRPLTDALPKPLVPFMGEPYAVGLLRRLAAAGCERATFLVGSDARPFAVLIAAGVALGIDVTAVGEETPLDTAGAARRLLHARTDEEPALVCNGDVLTDLDYTDLIARHREAGATATIALTRVRDTSSFGVVVRDGGERVTAFVEKPAPGTLADDTVNAGTYVLEAGALDSFDGDGPLSFEYDVFPGLLESGALLLGIASDVHWQDLGTLQRYLDGHRAVLDGRCAWPWGPGLRPAGGQTAVHENAEVDPDAVLEGAVVVGPGCSVGPRAVLRDAILHAKVRVGQDARVTRAILGERMSVERGEAVGGDDGDGVWAGVPRP